MAIQMKNEGTLLSNNSSRAIILKGVARLYDPTTRVWKVETDRDGWFDAKCLKFGSMRTNVKVNDIVILYVFGNRAFIAASVERDEELDESYQERDFIIKHDDAKLALYSEGTFSAEMTPLAFMTLSKKQHSFNLQAQNMYFASTNWQEIWSSIAGNGIYQLTFLPVAANILDKYNIKMDTTGISLDIYMGATSVKINKSGIIEISTGLTPGVPWAQIQVYPNGLIKVNGVRVELGKFGIKGQVLTNAYTKCPFIPLLLGSPTVSSY